MVGWLLVMLVFCLILVNFSGASSVDGGAWLLEKEKRPLRALKNYGEDENQNCVVVLLVVGLSVCFRR